MKFARDILGCDLVSPQTPLRAVLRMRLDVIMPALQRLLVFGYYNCMTALLCKFYKYNEKRFSPGIG